MITITTLNDGTSAISHAYSSIGSDVNQSQYIDITGTANGRVGKLRITASPGKPSPTGLSTRRVLVSFTAEVPVSTTVSGTAKTIVEKVGINFTATLPTSLPAGFAANEMRDLVGQMKSLLTDGVVTQLMRGEH